MTTQTEALKRIAAYPFSRAEELSVEQMREIAREALAQPEQEPVAIIHRNEYNEYRLEPHDNFDIKSIPFNVDVPLFKAPQRKPLTDEQMDAVTQAWAGHSLVSKERLIMCREYARAIEAAHGIKERNT